MSDSPNPYRAPEAESSPPRHWTGWVLGILVAVLCVLAGLLGVGGALLSLEWMLGDEAPPRLEDGLGAAALASGSLLLLHAGWSAFRGRWRRSARSAATGIGLVNVWLALRYVLSR
jgi:hypothetical protein